MSSLKAESPGRLSETNSLGLLYGHKAGSDYIEIFKPSTMAKVACTGEHGIPYHKIGRKVVYVKSELDAWLSAQLAGGVNHG